MKLKNIESKNNFTTNESTPYQDLLKEANFFARVEEILAKE